MMSEDDLIKRINESMAKSVKDICQDEIDYDNKIDAMEDVVDEVNHYLTQYFLNELITHPLDIRVSLAAQSVMLLKSISESYFKMIRQLIEKRKGEDDGKQD